MNFNPIQAKPLSLPPSTKSKEQLVADQVGAATQRLSAASPKELLCLLRFVLDAKGEEIKESDFSSVGGKLADDLNFAKLDLLKAYPADKFPDVRNSFSNGVRDAIVEKMPPGLQTACRKIIETYKHPNDHFPLREALMKWSRDAIDNPTQVSDSGTATQELDELVESLIVQDLPRTAGHIVCALGHIHGITDYPPSEKFENAFATVKGAYVEKHPGQAIAFNQAVIDCIVKELPDHIAKSYKEIVLSHELSSEKKKNYIEALVFHHRKNASPVLLFSAHSKAIDDEIDNAVRGFSQEWLKKATPLEIWDTLGLLTGVPRVPSTAAYRASLGLKQQLLSDYPPEWKDKINARCLRAFDNSLLEMLPDTKRQEFRHSSKTTTLEHWEWWRSEHDRLMREEDLRASAVASSGKNAAGGSPPKTAAESSTLAEFKAAALKKGSAEEEAAKTVLEPLNNALHTAAVPLKTLVHAACHVWGVDSIFAPPSEHAFSKTYDSERANYLKNHSSAEPFSKELQKAVAFLLPAGSPCRKDYENILNSASGYSKKQEQILEWMYTYGLSD